MKGNDQCLIVWAMEVMHATLEGGFKEGLGDIGSQGGLLYNSPNLGATYHRFMKGRDSLWEAPQPNWPCLKKGTMLSHTMDV
jgi:hypothetical protein